MGLNFIESWNGVGAAAEMIPKWVTEGGFTGGNATGRFGEASGAAVGLSTNYACSTDPLDPGTTNKLIVGFGYKVDDLVDAPFDIVEFRDGATQIFKIQMNADGTISGVRGSTIVHTSLHTILANTWHYIEVKVLLHNSTGTCQFQIDGAVGEAESTGLDTIEAGTACDNVRWKSTGTSEDWFLDDVYIADSSGATDFLGDVRVLTLVPDGDDSVQFTPTEVDNHSSVDDVLTNAADADYNESNTTTHKDIFTMAATGLAAGDTIHGIALNMWTKKIDAGAADMKLEVDSSGTTETSGAFTQTTAYGWFHWLRTLDPNVAGAWTQATVDALKAGYSRV